MFRGKNHRPAWPDPYHHPGDEVAVYTSEDGPFDECPLMDPCRYMQFLAFGYVPVMDQENVWRSGPIDVCFDTSWQRDFERIVFEVFGPKVAG